MNLCELDPEGETFRYPVSSKNGVRSPPLNSSLRHLGLLARLIGYAILLGLAVWLSLGETTLLLVLVSILLAAIVATSSIWDRPSEAAR